MFEKARIVGVCRKDRWALPPTGSADDPSFFCWLIEAIGWQEGR